MHRTLIDFPTLSLLLQQAATLSFDALLLQEVNISEEAINTLVTSNHPFIFAKSNKEERRCYRSFTSTMIILSPRWKICSQWSNEGGRICSAVVTDGYNTVNLFNVYLPSGLDRLTRTTAQWKEAFDLLNLASDKIDPDSTLIWGGDFNYTYRLKDRYSVAPTLDRPPRKIRQHTIEFESLLNHFFGVTDVSQDTRHTCLGTVEENDTLRGSSRLDRFYVSNPNDIRSVAYRDWRASFRTDHLAVIIELALHRPRKTILQPKIFTPNRIREYSKAVNTLLEEHPQIAVGEAQKAMTALVQEHFLVHSPKHIPNNLARAHTRRKRWRGIVRTIRKWWERMRESFFDASYYFGLRRQERHIRRTLRSLGINSMPDEDAITSLSRKFKRERQHLARKFKRKLKKLRKRCKSLSLYAKAHAHRILKKSARPATVAGFGGQLGREARKLAQAELEVLFGSRADEESDVNRLADALETRSFRPTKLKAEELLNIWKTASLPIDKDPSIWESVLRPIEPSDVDAYLKTLDVGGAAGADEISPLLFKTMWKECDSFNPWFIDVANKDLHRPRRNCNALVTFIPKHGKTQPGPGSARPITLLPIMRRCVSAIVNRRIEAVLDQEQDQILQPGTCGFIPSRGSDVAVERLLSAAATWRKKKLPTYIIQSDIQKAFDTIDWNQLEKGLTRLRIPDELRRFLLSSAKSVKHVRARVDGGLTGSVARQRGTPQGSPLSPLTYAFTADIVTKAIKLVLDERDLVFVYADDVVIVCHKKNTLSRVVDIINSTRLVCGLNFAPKKTEFRCKRKGWVKSISISGTCIPSKPLKTPLTILGVTIAIDATDLSYRDLVQNSLTAIRGNLHFVQMRCIHSLQLAVMYIREILVPSIEFRLRHLRASCWGNRGRMWSINASIARKISRIAHCKGLSPKSVHSLLDIPMVKDIVTIGQTTMLFRQCNSNPTDPGSTDIRLLLRDDNAPRYSSLRERLARLHLRIVSSPPWLHTIRDATHQWASSLRQDIRVPGPQHAILPEHDVFVFMKYVRTHFYYAVKTSQAIGAPTWTHAAKIQRMARETPLASFIASLCLVLRSVLADHILATIRDVSVLVESDFDFNTRFSKFHALSKSKRLRTQDAFWFTLLDRVVEELNLCLDVTVSFGSAPLLDEAYVTSLNLDPTPIVVLHPEEYILPTLLLREDLADGEFAVVTSDYRRLIRSRLRRCALERMKAGHHQGFFARSGNVQLVMKTALQHSDSMARFTLAALSNCLKIRNFASREFRDLKNDGDPLEPGNSNKRVACPCCLSKSEWYFDSLEHIFLFCPSHCEKRIEARKVLVDFVAEAQRKLGMVPEPTQLNTQLEFNVEQSLFPKTNPLAGMFGVLAAGEFRAACDTWFPVLRDKDRENGLPTVSQLQRGFILAALSAAQHLWNEHRRCYSLC